MDVVNPVEVLVYDTAKRLGGPDLINAVVTLQQPLLCVCVRGGLLQDKCINIHVVEMFSFSLLQFTSPITVSFINTGIYMVLLMSIINPFPENFNYCATGGSDKL